MKYLIHGLVLEVASRVEHLHGKFIYVYLCKPCKLLCSSLVYECTRRRLECQCIGKYRCAEKSSYRLIYLDILLFVHLIDDRSSTSKWLISEIHRIHGLYIRDPVVVDYLEYLGILHAVNRLGSLIVINKYELFLSRIDVVTP